MRFSIFKPHSVQRPPTENQTQTFRNMIKRKIQKNICLSWQNLLLSYSWAWIKLFHLFAWCFIIYYFMWHFYGAGCGDQFWRGTLVMKATFIGEYFQCKVETNLHKLHLFYFLYCFHICLKYMTSNEENELNNLKRLRNVH